MSSILGRIISVIQASVSQNLRIVDENQGEMGSSFSDHRQDGCQRLIHTLLYVKRENEDSPVPIRA